MIWPCFVLELTEGRDGIEGKLFFEEEAPVAGLPPDRTRVGDVSGLSLKQLENLWKNEARDSMTTLIFVEVK